MVDDISLYEVWWNCGAAECPSYALDHAPDAEGSVCTGDRVAYGLPGIIGQADPGEAHECKTLEWVKESVAAGLHGHHLSVECTVARGVVLVCVGAHDDVGWYACDQNALVAVVW